MTIWQAMMSVAHALVFLFFWTQDRSVERVAILFATKKVKQLQFFSYFDFCVVSYKFLPLYIANEKKNG